MRISSREVAAREARLEKSRHGAIPDSLIYHVPYPADVASDMRQMAGIARVVEKLVTVPS